MTMPNGFSIVCYLFPAVLNQDIKECLTGPMKVAWLVFTTFFQILQFLVFYLVITLISLVPNPILFNYLQ